MLHPVLHELHRPVQRHGVEPGQDVLGINTQLESETTASIGIRPPQSALVEAQALGQLLADQMRHLGRHVHGELACARLPFGQHGPGLHRQPGDPVDEEPTLDHHVGLGHAAVGVTPTLRVGDQQVGGQDAGVNDRGAGLERREDIGRRGEWFVVDLDELRRVLGHMATPGRHAHHRLPLIGGHALGQGEVRIVGAPGTGRRMPIGSLREATSAGTRTS